MRRTVEFVTVVTLAASTTLTGCADRSIPTGPTEATAESIHDRVTPSPFGALVRPAPLALPVSSTQAIGPEGGEIHLAAAGMTFVFPAGAVDHVTEITASAPASDFVEFRLEPEGTRLRLPATVRVEFGTSAGTALMRSTTPVPTGAGRSGLLTNRPVLEDWILLEPIQAAEEASRTQAVLYSVTLLSGYVCASG